MFALLFQKYGKPVGRQRSGEGHSSPVSEGVNLGLCSWRPCCQTFFHYLDSWRAASWTWGMNTGELSAKAGLWRRVAPTLGPTAPGTFMEGHTGQLLRCWVHRFQEACAVLAWWPGPWGQEAHLAWPVLCKRCWLLRTCPASADQCGSRA